MVGSVDDEGCDVELPKPAAMPALRHLTVRKVSAKCQKTFFKSVAPYLPQLVSVCMLLLRLHAPCQHQLRLYLHNGFVGTLLPCLVLRMVSCIATEQYCTCAHSY